MLKETPMLSLFLIDEISLNNDIWFQNNCFFLEIMTKSEGYLYLLQDFYFWICNTQSKICSFGAHFTVYSSSVWNEMYQSALELSDPFDIVENMPRRCGWQTTGANHPATTPKQYWKVSLFFAFIDHMIRQLESGVASSYQKIASLCCICFIVL